MTFNDAVNLPDGAMGYYASAEMPDHKAAVIVLQEIFGVNANIKRTVERFADAGFYAVAPDLFWRQRPGVSLDPESGDDRTEAMQLAQRYGEDIARGIDDLRALVAKLRTRYQKIGVVGYCLGGRVSFVSWLNLEVDAAVSYYGVGLAPFLNGMTVPAGPLLMHMGKDDPLNPPNVQAAIAARLGSEPQVDVRFYAGVGHAFARLGGRSYVPTAAEQADEATDEFLHRHLA
ncbi:dienelactone hydrolase family protein [Burkholderia cepacia]|uniref:dienelactone hydrolase family protein n=1 Tax=Burkholderia cepacia TaxID=292 RepID=UPI002AB66973|nr:dienelactone hydrolase family protein [Burkholderia cepacia]